MKKAIIILGLLGLALIVGLYAKRGPSDSKEQLENTVKQVVELSDSSLIKDGDIIFQTSLSQQSKAIQLATHSKSATLT